MINISEMIQYEDDDIIICWKEAGVAVQTKRLGEPDMESLLRNYLASSGKTPGVTPTLFIGVIHRLDQPVEGILVFAKNQKAAANLNKQMQGQEFEKYYLAVLQNRPTQKQAQLTDYLHKDGRSNTSAVVSKDTIGAKKSVLSYEVLTETEVGSLVRIKLQTGRHHQIRVQMAHLGCPLVGDSKYGNQSGPVALCAYHISFLHPATGKRVSFERLPQGIRFKDYLNLKSVLGQG